MSASTSPDVVVIGGGTAGCVVAGRLAERADRRVLLIEAGPDYGSRTSGRWPSDLLDASTLPTSHDWGYRGPAAGERALAFERARVMGGCSTHNGCTQSWGWSGDYDRWAANGLAGWAAADLRPHFEAATERMRVNRFAESEVQPFHRAFVEACEAAGIPRSADLDTLDGGIGVDVSPVNIVDGVRWNASFAYIDPVRERGHLEIWQHTTVLRVIVNAGCVTGVEVLRDNAVTTVSCDNVVLCAGAYGTPEILMRSGVGRGEDLASLGVDMQVELPGVGDNLHDHPAITLEFDASACLVAQLDAFRYEHGWLPEEQSLAKVSSSSSQGPFDLHIYPWVEPRPDSLTGWAAIIPVSLLTPASRGRLRVGLNGGVTPDHAYLAAPSDRAAMADGLATAQRLSAGDQLAPLLGTRLNPQQPDEGIDSWMIRTHSHYWHPAGTAAMGPADRGGVCDADGRVHGVVGLTLADASIFPEVPRSTPALPVVVVGERIAASMK
jgi:choline dehydrogenase